MPCFASLRATASPLLQVRIASLDVLLAPPALPPSGEGKGGPVSGDLVSLATIIASGLGGGALLCLLAVFAFAARRRQSTPLIAPLSKQVEMNTTGIRDALPAQVAWDSGEPRCKWRPGTGRKYACFLSHYKVEAGSEVRLPPSSAWLVCHC
jgi:hypothetical protein